MCIQITEKDHQSDLESARRAMKHQAKESQEFWNIEQPVKNANSRTK
jgi:hypothetical protein